MHNRDYWQGLLNQQRFSTHALIGGTRIVESH